MTESLPPVDGPLYHASLEARIAGMRSFLAALAPGSDAEALRALREAFPDLPLAERVKACGGWRR